MNHSKRLLRIAEKILADVHFSTQQEFDEYLKNHPNYREDTKFYVNGVQVKAPPREKNNDSSEMTDEQKKLHDMIKHPHEGARANIARNPKTHPKTLEKLSEDCSKYVRQEVARNPNTPLEILEKLSEDKHHGVRFWLVSNPKTPSEIINRLSKDEDSGVRSLVAKNPKTSIENLEKLSEDKNFGVREDVAKNPNTPSETLERLSKDHSDVRRSVAKNPNSENEMLDYIYDNDYSPFFKIPQERFWVIVHPNVGEETLKKALNNGGYYAEIAKKRLNGEKIPLLSDYWSPEKRIDFEKYHSDYFKSLRLKTNFNLQEDYDDEDYDDEDYDDEDYDDEDYDDESYWR